MESAVLVELFQPAGAAIHEQKENKVFTEAVNLGWTGATELY